MQRTLQRISSLILLWIILWLAGLDAQMMWVLWTVPLLVLLLEHLAYMQGVAQGFEIYSTLTAEQRRDVQRILDGQDE